MTATEQTIRTTCPYCGTGCGVSATVADGAVSIAGDDAHPANFGRLCVKGAALAQTLTGEERLLSPQIGGVKATWTDALDLTAAMFRQTIAEHGPDSVAFYVSGQILTEDYYVANKLMKGFIGSANIDTNSRLCMSASVAGHKRAFGADTVPGVYEDFEEADLVILVGSNLAWCHPVLYQRLAATREKRGGKPLVVNIDPRRTATSELADLQLSLAPGSDVALFAGLLRELDKTGRRNKKFVADHTQGLDEALAEAKQWTPKKVAATTGLTLDELQKFYDLVGATPKTVTVYSQGVNQSSSGADKVNAIINTHLLTGRIGAPGCGPFSVTGQPNAMGGREVGGLANMLAAHMELENENHRALVKKFWRTPILAAKPGLKAVELFKAIGEGRVKAVWIMATNPVDSLPDSDVVRTALQKCPFVVVSDVVTRNDSMPYAHVLLPALAWGEKDGTVTNSERRISRQRALRPASGEARADWRIICDVARRMGFGEAFAFDSAAAIFREHAALSGFGNEGARDFDISAHAQISDADFESLPPFQWPAPAGKAASDEPKRFFADGEFYTDSGRANFVATKFRGLATSTDSAHPFVLNTGRIRDQWHTMTRTGRAPNLSQHIAEPFAEINPVDAARLEIKPADLVRVSNARGSVILRAQITERQRRGSVFAPIHWTDEFASHARIGALIAPIVDPISGQPESKAGAVDIEPLDFAWYGFALLRRKPRKLAYDYWALARIEGGYRLELAGHKTPADWTQFFRELLGDDAGNLIEARDAKSGAYRVVAAEAETVAGALYVARQPVEAARSWLCEQFAAPQADPSLLLAGRPPRSSKDPGKKICVCFNVGANTIAEAIEAGGLTNADAVGKATAAGTGCGSCKPEIERLLVESASTLETSAGC